ncbi:MAG: hypothetical protein ACLGHN_15855 [Bacteriovoracia bacterium]
MKKTFFALFLSATSLSAPAWALQERVMTVERLSNASSYFRINIQDGGLLQGSFAGWCADWASKIEDGKTYHAKFYSSYQEDIPAGVVDKPENLDEMNWLINQHAVGKTSPGGHGTYTSGDVQLAIWTLLDDNFDTTTVGPFSQDRVDELVAKALTQGSDFYPNCSQLVGILLDPTDPETGNNVQSTVTEVPRRKFPKCVIPEGE